MQIHRYVLALVLLALPSCQPPAAVQSVAQWMPTIFAALGTAESAIGVIQGWANRFEGLPAVAAALPRLTALLEQARQDLGQARELAKRGAEFESGAKDLYRRGVAAISQATELLQRLKMYQEGRLLAPPTPPATGDPCVRSVTVDEMALELPPGEV